MEAIPLREDWSQDPEILVTPLSLTQFWDCYWADNAIYYLNALHRDPDDYITKSTAWSDPVITETFLDEPVLQERVILKTIRNREPFTADWSYIDQHYMLLEKTDTKIRIAERHITSNAPYTDKFQVWFYWEFITPDPESYQVVFRKQYFIHWNSGKKPLVWRTIVKYVRRGIADFNDQYAEFF